MDMKRKSMWMYFVRRRLLFCVNAGDVTFLLRKLHFTASAHASNIDDH